MTPDISKLPKWVQAHIHDLELQRDLALRNIKEFEDQQQECPFRQLVATPNDQGDIKHIHRYIHGRNIEVSWKGLALDITLVEDGVRINFGCEKRRLSGGAAIQPQAGNSILIREVMFE